MGTITKWGVKILLPFLLPTWLGACGKVTNLSQAAGLVDAATLPLIMTAQELIPATPGVPYKEILSAKGGQAPYSYAIIQGQLFNGLALDGATGIISGQIDKSLAAQQAIFTVEVTDAGGLKAQQSYTLKAAAYTFAIAPAETPQVIPGITFAMKFNAPGAVEPVKYSLSGALPLNLKLSGEGALMTEGGGVPDTSANTQWPIEITASDANNVAAKANYTVIVGEAPEMAALSIVSTQLHGVQVGAYTGGISTAGGMLPFTFTIEGGALPTGLSLNASSGVISGTIPSASANNAYAVVIKVTDAIGQVASRTFTGNVGAGNSTLQIHTTTLSQMSASSAYSYALAVTGGTTPYNFTVSSGSLPGGLSLNASTGTLSGTVSAGMGGQAYAFVVTVTDADGQTATKTYTGTVATSASSSVSIVSTTLPAPTAGQSYLASVGAMGGTPPYSFAVSSGTLPTGLTLNASTGVISGTVAHAQKGAAYVFTVTVTDAAALTANQVYAGTVNTYTTAVVPAALAAATPGALYATGLATTGGEAPYTYTLTSGTLPVGLSLNGSTGVISGTISEAEAGTTRNFSIRSTDANNVQITQALSLTTNAFAVTLTTASLSDAVESAMYSNGGVNLAATGGTAPYTFEYTGSLPSGIGLTSAGAFFGVPDTGTGSLPSGTNYSIYVRARDAAGQASAQVTLTLKVTISAPVVSGTAPGTAVLGASYSHTLSASGGRGPYSFSLVSGSLPTGLSLSGGVISGTATASATCPAATFTVKAVDVLGQNSANANKCIPTATGVSISNTSFPTIVVGTNYGATVNATGGTAPYAFSSTGLPSGVSLHASTGSLSGFVNDPTGDYTAYITVTDSSSPALSTTRSFTFKVRDPLTISTTTVPRAGAGASYGPTSITATGGQAPYTFAITSGTLPSGLTMTSGGVISGTAALNTAAGVSSYNFTVVATDAAGQTSPAQALTMDISVAPRITTPRLPAASVGITYAYDVERTGGVNPFISAANLASQLTWGASGLPAGLSINSASGRISGTPAAGADTSSPYSVTLSVTDANGITGTRTVQMEVRASALTLDLASARTEIPCPASGLANCESIAYGIGTLVPAQSTTKYMVYAALYSGTTAAPTATSIHIARIDATGHIPRPGTSSLSVAYTPSSVGWITSIDIADIDNDTYPDIVFSDRTNNKIVVVWNSGTTDGNGMPVFSSENSFAMPASGARPYKVKVAAVRPDAGNANKKDLVVADWDPLAAATVGRMVVFLAQNSCSVNCSASRATVYTGAGASITAYNTTLIGPGVGMIYLGGVDVGYFDTAPGPTVCPSLVVTGRRVNTSNDDYVFLRHQSYSGGCTGDFSTHAASDQKAITTNGNGLPSAPAVADFNNDGISDIALVLRWTSQANSANVKVYLMPGGNAFPANPLTPLLPTSTTPANNYIGGSIIPYCADGSASCSYPSLLVAGGRDRGTVIAAGTATTHGFLSLIPNQGGAPWFEDLTGNNRIDFLAPPGIGVNGIIATPLVTSGKNDIAFMGVDNTAYPYYFMLPRNGSSTTAPFRQMQQLKSMPTYLAAGGEVGTTRLIDVDGDAQLDIASHLVNQASLSLTVGDTSQILESDVPDPGFSPIGSNFGFPTAWYYQNTMDVADFNEDGHPDLVVAGNGGRLLTVAFGDGSNTVSSTAQVEPGITGELFPRAVVAADFDNDGHQDFVSFNYNNNTAQSSMSFFKGNGTGSFNAASEFMLANGVGCNDVRAMIARDLNGDGRPEIAALCYASQALWILRRHTDGTWVKNSGATVNTSGGANGTVLAAGRLTSTTGTDFVVGGLDVTNSYRLITGLQLGAPDAGGSFTVSASLHGYQTAGGYMSNAAITDLNNDGYGDLVLTPATQSGGTGAVNSTFFYTCLTSGVGACSTKAWGGDGYGYTSIAVGDLNDDGKADFVMGNRIGQRKFFRMITRVLNQSY